MNILFDLQEYLMDKPLGELKGSKLIGSYGEMRPSLIVEQVEDIKVIRVANRKNNNTGVCVNLSLIKNIYAGCIVTLVGRQMLTLHGVRFALYASENDSKELVYNEPKNNLYSLSYTLTSEMINCVYLSTSKSGVLFSGMDFFIDGLLVVHH